MLSMKWIYFINLEISCWNLQGFIQRTMILGTNYSIFVFGQYFSFSYFSTLASFIPSSLSLWPHQSIVYKKALHSKYGNYNVAFRYCADQIFFAHVRKYESYFISDHITSLFITDGISSGFSFAYSMELWQLYRILHYDFFRSLLFSFVLPSLKCFLKLFLPQSIIHKLQNFVTSRR